MIGFGWLTPALDIISGALKAWNAKRDLANTPEMKEGATAQLAVNRTNEINRLNGVLASTTATKAEKDAAEKRLEEMDAE
jgi:hypothetical protein